MKRKKPPSFAEVQRLLASLPDTLPRWQRANLNSASLEERMAARRALSKRFAAALRRRGWLAEEGYAS